MFDLGNNARYDIHANSTTSSLQAAVAQPVPSLDSVTQTLSQIARLSSMVARNIDTCIPRGYTTCAQAGVPAS